MKIEQMLPRIDTPARFFIALNLMVGIVFLLAVISVGIMFYGGLQFIAH